MFKTSFSKYKLRDISLYFKSSCCNTTNSSIVNTLVETMPKLPASLPVKNNLPYYEFTSTFDLNKLRYSSDCIDLNSILYKKYKNTMIKYIKKYLIKKQKAYLFYAMPEYTKSGLLHFHVLCYFDNANDHYCNRLILYSGRKFGRTVGKKVYNKENYVRYISKDFNVTNKLLPIYIQENMEPSPKE